MKETTARPQINASKLVIGGGIIGAVFAAGSMSIFLIGIPILRVMLPAAMVLGVAVAIVFHFKRHETPGAPWITPVTEKKTEVLSTPESTGDTTRSTKGLLTVQSPAHFSSAIS